jgi:hypothetical protein
MTAQHRLADVFAAGDQEVAPVGIARIEGELRDGACVAGAHQRLTLGMKG